MKKLFTFFLALITSVSTLFAASGTCGKNLTWDLSDGVLTISGTGTMTEFSSAKSVPWYGLRTSIKSVIVKNTVTSIGSDAFCECTALTSVEIPNSVTSIGASAFFGCTSLTSIEIPNSVTSIGKEAFGVCSGLTSVTIGSGVTSIGIGAFRACIDLTSVTIPNSVTNILQGAFESCKSLTSIEIPNSVTNIEDDAFSYCTGLTSVTIPNNLSNIGIGVFYGCTGLTTPVYNAHVFAFMPTTYSGAYTIPNGIKSIAGAAFKYCTGLSSIEIPNSVTNIGESAFSSCSGLTSIEIPNSVTNIGGCAFSSCSSLTSVEIPTSVTSIGSSAFSSCWSLTSIEIPNSVTKIGGYAFSGCSGLTSVEIPNSVTSMGDCAFDYCSGLTSVTIGNSVISKSIFSHCTGLTSVTIGNSVTSIGEYAFQHCTGLVSLTIPINITKIGNFAFDACSNLRIIYSKPLARPTISSNTFRNISSEAIVLVPTESLNAYKNASYWENLNIQPTIDCKSIVSSTSVSISFINNIWDLLFNENIVSCGIDGGETFDGNTLEYIGLEPNSEYNGIHMVLTSNKGETETANISYKTTELELTTQPSKPVSSTTAILLANTNMSDAEVSCGFEWRRNDAPEDMTSTKVYCPVANGTMAGRLKGLKEDVYYKYRAFYQSAAGNMYYGDWQYIFTGDNTVEFDPVLYTYAPVSVGEEEATLKGYAIAGSDDFTEQGFEYWADSRVPQQNEAPRHMPAALGEHMTVQAEGISMKVTLTDLDPGTVYKYRTYAKIGDKMLYGAEMSFTTKGEYIEEEGGEEGGEEALESLSGNAAPFATKLLRNGQILILRGSRTYTLTGQEVK